jgi:hypothetical protein
MSGKPTNSSVAKLNRELKPQGKRWCSKCESVVSLKNVSRAGCCFECSRKQAKAWRAQNPELKSAQNRRYRTEGPQDRRPVMVRAGKSEMAKLFDELTALVEFGTPPDHHQDDDVHTLYRFFDASGVLLYVGITYNPPSRFRSHEGDKEWWGQVRTIELEQFISRKAVLHAEREAISTELPLFNVMHSCRF